MADERGNEEGFMKKAPECHVTIEEITFVNFCYESKLSERLADRENEEGFMKKAPECHAKILLIFFFVTRVKAKLSIRLAG